MEEIWKAAERAHAAEFIEDLPKGYDSFFRRTGREVIRRAASANRHRKSVTKRS